MARKYTIFQNIDRAFSGDWNHDASEPHINSYDMSTADKSILYRTTNKDDYESKKLELQQNAYLKDRWIKANVDLSVSAYSGLNNVKLMYRDADLMDAFPEIGAALDIVTEESTITSDKGMIVNVYSKSDRIKSILEDLFVNRLNIQVTAPMVVRAMCKYGNQFMLLDIDNKLGVKGWKQLPVFNVERIENGVANPYGAIATQYTNTNNIDTSTKFIWVNENNSQVPFRNWQIAHFRLLTNSLYLPYGCSYLNAARRHWRMLSLMEDLMLIYRLERSIERRVYKIYVGAIDDADVQAYVENIANNFKRTPIIDPMTGQLDLRKNILPVHKDTPIPLLDGRTITIENLAKEFENGKENYVYSVQDKTLKIVPGKVVWCGKNYTAEKLIRITLDDGSHFDLAAEHEIIMRDGTKKRADEVSIGESVMPLYRKIEPYSKTYKASYEKVYNPNSGKYEFTHRLVGFELKHNIDENVIHHSDFNRYNNSPSNLKWMNWDEHRKLHCSMKDILSERMTKFNSTKEAKDERKKRGLELGYREDFRKYNESELHTIHNEIRRICNIKKWQNQDIRNKAIKNMTVKFDSYVWEEIRKGILSNKITTQNGLINYINENLIEYLLSHNSSKKLHHYKKVSKPLVRARIVENGFSDFKEYYASIKKNHKIANIEIVGGDDVYCMTVVGLNGEEDRHNFALTTWKSDGSLNESGVFVSNCCDQDIFIPVRDQNAPTPIDTLSAAQNLTAMDDIKFVQDKVCTALRIPKTFLNFEEAQGNGNNLALEDIRFTRTVNRIQQAFLMELTKVASIHLYLLGFTDDLTNFNLTMNNPSTQAEQLEIDNLQKKITAARDAISDPGNGIPIMSQTRALKEIMKWSEKDIKDNLEEIRLEKGIAAELEKTSQIIKRTGLFDTVDRMYGEPGAEYQDDVQQQGDPMGGGGLGGGGGAPMGGGDFGSGLDDLGAPDSDENGDIAGAEGSEPTADMDSGTDTGGADENAGGPPNESRRSRKPMLAESKRRMYKKIIKESEEKADQLFSQYLRRLDEANEKKKQETSIEKADIYDKSLMINEEFNKMLNGLNKKLNENNEKVD